jgi:RNA polymerase sigma-70 factor (ECF subfamily)
MLRIFRKQPDSLSDAELIERYKNSEDTSYLGVLMERYTELVYGVCLKILQDESEAQDAFMTVFEKLIVKAKTQDIKDFRPWLHVLVKNHCFEILRKQKRQLTVSYDHPFMQSEPFEHPFSEDLSLEREAALEKCLETLNAQQKDCVRLFYFEGKSYAEIAESKSEVLGKIRSNIQNGRRNLRICIEKRIEEESRH